MVQPCGSSPAGREAALEVAVQCLPWNFGLEVFSGDLGVTR